MKPEDFRYTVSDPGEKLTEALKDYFYSAIEAKVEVTLTLNS